MSKILLRHIILVCKKLSFPEYLYCRIFLSLFLNCSTFVWLCMSVSVSICQEHVEVGERLTGIDLLLIFGHWELNLGLPGLIVRLY